MKKQDNPRGSQPDKPVIKPARPAPEGQELSDEYAARGLFALISAGVPDRLAGKMKKTVFAGLSLIKPGTLKRRKLIFNLTMFYLFMVRGFMNQPEARLTARGAAAYRARFGGEAPPAETSDGLEGLKGGEMESFLEGRFGPEEEFHLAGDFSGAGARLIRFLEGEGRREIALTAGAFKEDRGLASKTIRESLSGAAPLTPIVFMEIVRRLDFGRHMVSGGSARDAQKGRGGDLKRH